MANFLKSLFVKGIEIDPAGATSDQVLKYNGTKFVPGTASTVGSIDDLSDVIVTTPSNGQALVFDGTNWVNGASGVAGSTYTATIGDGTNDVFVLSHGLNTRDVFVTIRNAASPYEVIDAYWAATTTGTVTIDFSVVPTTNSVRVAIYAAVTGNNTALSLDNLTDAVITSPLEYESLVYNGTNWVNQYASTATYVRNAEATTLTTGTVVYLFGATGDHATVKRADNDSDATSSKTVGLVASPIAASENGPVVTRGYVDGINLSTGYTSGDVLWLGEDGAFTKVKPTAPEHLVFIGVVVRATNNGIVYVATQNGYELDELHDVSLPNPTAGQVLTYNGSLWTAASASGVDTINDLGDVVITSPTDGQVLKYNTATSLWTNASAGGGASITVSDTPPVSPAAGALWFESDSGLTFIYYDSQWIEIGAGASYDPITGTIQAKGDLIVGTASQTVDRLTVGTNNQRLIANSSASTGVSWASDSTNTVIDAKGDLLVGATNDVVAKLPVGTDNQMLVANSSATNGLAWVDQPTGFRNVLINGALDVWQRGTTFTASGSYSADRFIVGRSGGASGATFTRVSPNDSTNLPNFRYAMRCQRDSGNTGTAGLTFGQVIETSNSIPLAGKTVTLSFYARCGANFTGTYLNSYVYTGTGTDQNGILGSWTGSANPIQGSHTLTTTWARYSATGTLSSTTNEIFFNFANAPSGTAGANDWYEVTGIQLEVGAQPTPFEQRPIGLELALCQRYYWRQNSEVTGVSQRIGGTGSIYGGNTFVGVFNMPVTMRTRPTGSLEYSGLMCTDDISFDSTGGTWSISTNYGSPRSVLIYGGPLTGTVSMQYVKLGIQSGANNYMAISAEL